MNETDCPQLVLVLVKQGVSLVPLDVFLHREDLKKGNYLPKKKKKNSIPPLFYYRYVPFSGCKLSGDARPGSWWYDDEQ